MGLKYFSVFFTPLLGTIQDFLCELDIKPQTNLVETIIFSQYHVIVRPTKIIKGANENWAQL